MLKALVPGCLWVAEMPASRAGFEFGARMTVVKLRSAELWVHSPIALTAELRASLDAQGPVRHVVAPSGMHYEHVPEFARVYPEAGVYAAEAARSKLGDLQGVQVLGGEPPAAWAGEIEQLPFRGSRMYDEVVFFHQPTRTLMLTDLCFNIPDSRGFTTSVWASLLGVRGELSASRTFHWSVKDRTVVSTCLRRILEWDFDRVLLTHGDLVLNDGKSAFWSAFGRYLN